MYSGLALLTDLSDNRVTVSNGFDFCNSKITSGLWRLASPQAGRHRNVHQIGDREDCNVSTVPHVIVKDVELTYLSP